MPTVTPVQVPRDYAAWLDCFARLQDGFTDAEFLHSLRRGSLTADPTLLAKFQTRLLQTVNAMLSRRATTFLRQYRILADDGDAYALEMLYRRFLRAAKDCLFFTALGFLPEGFRTELADGLRHEVDRLTGQLLKNLEQNNAIELRDAIAAIHRGATLC